MSESLPPHLKSCTQCGAELPADGTNGLCPACLMAEAMKPSGPKKPWVPPSADEVAPHFPQYEIQRMLGRGGMGAVYLARQISLNRLVAIKILPADIDDGFNNFAERFKNEAQAMAQLSHPGIVAVFDFGETMSGLLYIVMEYIDGTDVQQMVAQQGRLHSAHAMAITAHVCDALGYAHSRGIIHRDIKPSNIMVSNDGMVKVADFGLAKMSQGEQAASLTQSGMAMGTLHFMAPEALTLGTAVDQRADIYAVGVMLYQMLTGKLPQGLFEMPSLQVPGLDPRYDGIVAKALREDRAVRYQQASELRQDLDAILTQPVVKVEPEAGQAPAAMPPPAAKPQRPAGQPYRPPPRSAPPPPRKKSRTGLIIVALVMLAVIAVAVFFLTGKGSATPQAAQATKDQPFVNTLGMKFVPVPITGGPTSGKTVLFSVWETRVQDYAVFAAEKQLEWAKPNFAQQPLHPVVNISWDEAQAFCSWLTDRERTAGRLSAEDRYRLPSDHEWSSAAGLGDREDPAKQPSEKSEQLANVFPWGSAWPPPPGTGNYAGEELQAKVSARTYPFIKGILAGYRDEYLETAPVGSFPADSLGLYDLSGNAREWCEDWWDASKRDRVLRGGSWGNEIPSRLLSSHRDHFAPFRRYIAYGFRVVLEVSSDTTKPSGKPIAVTQPIPAPEKKPPGTLPSGDSAKSSKDAPFVNTLGMKFVPIPETKVLMCIHETRRQDYAVFAAETPGVSIAWQRQVLDGVPCGDKDDHPVVAVSWHDAGSFCEWISRKERRSYRLPTDREWSVAVGLGGEEEQAEGVTPEKLRMGITNEFPWGGDYPPRTQDQAGNYGDMAWRERFPTQPFIDSYSDGFATTSPVMSFKANKLGLHDLGGNVWEWCEDPFNSTLKDRTLRGASFRACDRGALLSSVRSNRPPGYGDRTIGFRCVLEISSQTAPASAESAPKP